MVRNHIDGRRKRRPLTVHGSQCRMAVLIDKRLGFCFLMHLWSCSPFPVSRFTAGLSNPVIGLPAAPHHNPLQREPTV